MFSPADCDVLHFSGDMKKIELDNATVAALVPIENTDLETATLSTHPRFLALIERSRSRQKAEGGISSAEMRRRLNRTKQGS